MGGYRCHRGCSSCGRLLLVRALAVVALAAVPCAEALAAAGTASPTPSHSHPSLDILLRTPRDPVPAAIRVDLPREELPPPSTGGPGAIDQMKSRIRLERRTESIGRAGPRQGTHSETDAGLRIPLDKDVSLEGGVRVDQRDEPGVKAPQRKSTPRVGVEVRF